MQKYGESNIELENISVGKGLVLNCNAPLCEEGNGSPKTNA